MTTYLNTWISDINRVPASQANPTVQKKYLAWYIKALVKNAGLGMATSAGAWSVVGSSDGTAAALDGTDRWTDTYNIAALVHGDTGQPRSWIVLKSPNGIGPVYMCIQLGTTQVDAINITMSLSAFTGGSTTARPTHANEMDFGTISCVPNNAGIKIHSSLASNGAFWILVSVDGSGNFGWALVHSALTDTRVGEAANSFTFCRSLSAGNILTRNVLGNSYGWVARKSDNSIGVVVQSTYPSYAGSTPLFQTLSTVDGTDGRYLDFPIHMFSTTLGAISLRGRLQDIFWAPDLTPTGTLEPVGGPYTGLVAGNLWLPVATTTVPQL